ncbi:DUF3419 family protein [Sebaldella sp. S0638]|uniref:DUF3419 family protein n=1 Tax=Sebaldella sp. S0638 TaxID=2957809 RepID=UPI0020A1D2AC|nr:DUF3419 family protein [Sebaldella sp. S0638]MCP1222931.1 BtaA family protein [Sebaldella sp. S0638]
MESEVSRKVDFSIIRYAQCWEDPEILLEVLDIKEGDVCMSIASAGENTFAMLVKNPGKIIGIDLNPVQLRLVELKKAAFLALEYEEMLEFLGFSESRRRKEYYGKLKDYLLGETEKYWNENMALIEAGVINTGRFDNFFQIFRKKVLSLIHSQKRVAELLEKKNKEERYEFYNKKWNNLRWKILFRIFFSKFIVGKLGRDPRLFDYADNTSLSAVMSEKAKYAFTELDVSENPYIEYILTGKYTKNLPFAMRKENFQKIKSNLNRLELHNVSIEKYLETSEETIDKFNLSDIFEYISSEKYKELLEKIYEFSSNGAVLAYWNMMVPRSRPEELGNKIISLSETAKNLHAIDKTFFYSGFVVERIVK